MNEKTLRTIRTVSFILIAAATIVLGVEIVTGSVLPDAARWIIGAVELIALPVLVFTTVKLHRLGD